MLGEIARRAVLDEDHRALAAACKPGTGLCTIVDIEGSFSRRLGAQMAVLSTGDTVGSLADGCLEAQLSADIRSLDRPAISRYGRGSPKIDFRLPCGGGLDILLDPAPDRDACRNALAHLSNREPARLALPEISPLAERRYLPALQLVAMGEGPELQGLERLAHAMGIAIDARTKERLALGRPAPDCTFDPWTALVLMFHDHEWEPALLKQALAGDAFYIGAQGGENARIERSLTLAARGVCEEQIARIRSPVGLIPACRTPDALAISVLAEIVGQYERILAGP